MLKFEEKTVTGIFRCEKVRYVDHSDGLHTPFQEGGVDLIDDDGRVHEVQSDLLGALEAGAFYIVDFEGGERALIPADVLDAGITNDQADATS